MTIFRYEEAPRGLLKAFLDVRQNWCPGEVQTLTGYDQSEYAALESQGSEEVLPMLRQAANTLLGLPSTSAAACVEYIGSDWPERLRTFLDNTHSMDVNQ